MTYSVIFKNLKHLPKYCNTIDEAKKFISTKQYPDQWEIVDYYPECFYNYAPEKRYCLFCNAICERRGSEHKDV